MRLLYRAAISAALLFLLACAEGPPRPNVILIIVDTLRADHLGCYGYRRNTSPSIDSLAEAGTRWTRVTAQANWTLPATASIFSGLTVRSHGVMMTSTGATYGFDPKTPTIATILESRGYSTGGFVNVYLLSERLGFHRGFECYHANSMGHGRAGDTVDRFLQWRRSDDSSAPFLAVIHLYDVHDPYDPPQQYDTLYTESGACGLTNWTRTPGDAAANPDEKPHLMGLYDGEIRWVDSQLSRIFAWLRESGKADSTLVIVTADHGEAFLEREGRPGILHRSLYQEVIHVPLIISGPGIDSATVDSAPAGQYDILPTVLGCLEMEQQGDFDGRDLLARGERERRVIPTTRLRASRAAVTGGNRKVMWIARADSTVMYDLEEDPMEREALAAPAGLEEQVMDFWATPCRWDPVRVSDRELQSALRDLGYI